ncbi:PspC domain-containing protein [Amycolatopsis benzoatilytica]|uniref:PspC domain-containing protein n=1 Tax=Amycolatopsis benzoatilytica TaxID=346045 RepID=UPI0003A0B0CF|nr:PspC domain-containing protein [Amycolatopsis benzoatilytica]
MSGANEARSPRTNPLNGFEETVKDFWASRPRRPHSRRKVAGVAAALGDRYGIDPVVIRVALVAATVFGGFGLMFYLLGWLFFPEEHDETSGFEALLGRGHSSMSKVFTIALSIAVIPVGGWTFGGVGWFDGGGLIGFALISTCLYLLHRTRGQDNRPAPVAAFAAAAPAASGTGAFTMNSDAPTSAAAPGWDPLAADPAGWDLPEPATPADNYDYNEPSAPRPPRRRSKVGAATFGTAIIVAGVGIALGFNGIDWFSLQHIIGLTLGVLGIGLVAGAFARGGKGLIALAIPLSIAGLVLTNSTFDNFNVRGGVGDLSASPRSVAELQPVYRHAAGNIRLDLTQLPATGPISTTVSNGAGDTKVVVPANADVTFTCDTSAGSIDCLNRSSDGVGQPTISGTDNGADGPGGQQITLHVKNGVGNVEVLRG